MRKFSLIWLIGLYLCVLLGAAILTPILYQCVQLIDHICSLKALHHLATKPLSQYLDRIRMVSFFTTVLWLSKSNHFWENWHLRGTFKHYLSTFVAGCLLWCVLFAVIMAVIPPVFHYPDGHLRFVGAFIGSFFLVCLEEIMFRGFLWDALRTRYSVGLSTLFLSLLFALMHFSMCTDSEHPSLWIQSFLCAKSSLVNIAHGFQLTYFLCLFLLSGLLIHLRTQCQTLWASIGFHQGLVFVLLLSRQWYYFAPQPPSWWGNGSLTHSWFVLCVLLVIYLWTFLAKNGLLRHQNLPIEKRFKKQ